MMVMMTQKHIQHYMCMMLTYTRLTKGLIAQ